MLRSDWMAISFLDQKYSSQEISKILHPLVKEWFFSEFKDFTEPQKYSILEIHNKQNTLVSAATGTGKTLSGFLAIINELVYLAESDQLEDKVYCIYNSPLKALVNDIDRNLKEPLEKIKALAEKKGKKIDIRVAIRTGDTPTAERAKMLRKPPHLLLTTPESLAILLTSPKFVEYLKDTKWCIVDEVHALAENKRGVHLSLSLERLQRLAPNLCRIGLSATVAPLEEMAKFLVGMKNEKEPCDCKVIDVKFLKELDLKVLSPLPDLINVTATKIQDRLYNVLHQLIQQHKTTLVFTNTRSATERVVHNLKDRFPTAYYKGNLDAHHSSISRDKRLNVENRLKEGELKAVVCLDGNTKILTSRGSWKKISDIGNERVATLNKQLLLENAKVKSKISTIGRQQTLKIKTALGKEIICTPNHKFLSIEKSRLKWIEAKELSSKSFVATVRRYNAMPITKPELEMLCFANYPEEYFVKLANSFLVEIKSRVISEYGSIRAFWKKAQIPESLSFFGRTLNGEFLMKIGNCKKIASMLDVDASTIFKNIKGVSSSKYIMPKPIITKGLMRLLGFMMAEGYISDRALFVSNRNRAVLTYYAGLIKKLRGRKAFLKMGSTGTPILVWDSMFLSKFLRSLGFVSGRKARKMWIPPFVFNLDKKLIFEFISGYFDGDGFVENKQGKRVYSAGFCTTSKKMAGDLGRLLLREGILLSIRSKKYDEIQITGNRNIIKKKGWFYTCSILGGDNLRLFAKNVTPVRENISKIKGVLKLRGYCNMDVIPNVKEELVSERSLANISTYSLQKNGLPNPAKYEIGARQISRKKLHELLNIYKSKNLFLKSLNDSDIFWEKIKEIKDTKLNEKVYNLEVENTHNYIANGFITKNCSTSLELGIDIGYIDLVILLGSPKSIARALQRIGRSGHRLHDTVKGRIIVLDRDDLVECAVLLKNAKEHRIDKVNIPRNCLDVLAQQIYGIAIASKIKERDLFNLIRGSYCYSSLPKDDFNEIIKYLAGHYSSLETRHVYAKIWFDEETGMIGRRGKLARVLYMTNVGTIPEEARIKVKIGTQKIGTLDEGFVERLRPGDVFVLAGQSYLFKYSRGNTVQVQSAAKRPPTVPSWFSQMLPLSFDLALEIQRFRSLMEEKLRAGKSKAEIMKFINTYLYLDKNAASAICSYFQDQFLFSQIPSEKKLLIEHYTDEEGKRFAIFHSLYGRRVNDALSRALAYLIGRLTHKDVEITLSDNGFVLSAEKLPVQQALNLFKKNSVREVAELALERTEVMKRRFRHCATRALMILRNYKGKTKSVGRQQMSSRLLLLAVKRISENFPILKETRREVLEDLMDISATEQVIDWLQKGKVKVVEANSSTPSPFAFSLYAQGYSDVMKMEGKLQFIRRMHEKVKGKIREKG